MVLAICLGGMAGEGCWPTGGLAGKAGAAGGDTRTGVLGGVLTGVKGFLLLLLADARPEMPICIAALASIAPVIRLDPY